MPVVFSSGSYSRIGALTCGLTGAAPTASGMQTQCDRRVQCRPIVGLWGSSMVPHVPEENHAAVPKCDHPRQVEQPESPRKDTAKHSMRLRFLAYPLRNLLAEKSGNAPGDSACNCSACGCCDTNEPILAESPPHPDDKSHENSQERKYRGDTYHSSLMRTIPNDASQWRRGKSAGNWTEAESRRPLHSPG